MLQKIQLTITYLVLCIVFASCEYSYHYQYKVINNADSAVILHLKTYQGDTTITIPVDSQYVVFATTHGVEGSHGPYFKDVSSDLDSCAISKNGRQSSKNYRADTPWSFIKANKIGLYSATVSNTEF